MSDLFEIVNLELQYPELGTHGYPCAARHFKLRHKYSSQGPKQKDQDFLDTLQAELELP